jgi:hypothetical protein
MQRQSMNKIAPSSINGSNERVVSKRTAFLDQHALAPFAIPVNLRKCTGNSFPVKLMEMMEYAKLTNSRNCGWSDDGLSIIIRSPNDFMRHIVPRFFKGTKFQSFQSKLYRWGFRVVWHSHKQVACYDEVLVYRQDSFQRGRMDLIGNMQSVTASNRKPASHKDKDASQPTLWEQPEAYSFLSFLLDKSRESLEAPPARTMAAGKYSRDSGNDHAPPSHFEDDLSLPSSDRVPLAELKMALLRNDVNISSLLTLYNLEPNPISLESYPF